MTSKRDQARSFAIAAHGTQMYGAHPYSYHLDAVAAIAGDYGEAAVVTAYLHDTVEDTDATLAQVEKEFGSDIAACVDLLTDADGANRKARKAKTYAKLAQVSGPLELALIVKAADRLANVRACVHDQNERLLQIYRGEHEEFRLAAYRSGLCDVLWTELDALLA